LVIWVGTIGAFSGLENIYFDGETPEDIGAGFFCMANGSPFAVCGLDLTQTAIEGSVKSDHRVDECRLSESQVLFDVSALPRATDPNVELKLATFRKAGTLANFALFFGKEPPLICGFVLRREENFIGI
jgi:hypothetical protein